MYCVKVSGVQVVWCVLCKGIWSTGSMVCSGGSKGGLGGSMEPPLDKTFNFLTD